MTVMTVLEWLEPWWRHPMETLSALLALCEGNSPVNTPHNGQYRGALMFSLICVWKKMSKQSRRRWFETPLRSLWRSSTARKAGVYMYGFPNLLELHPPPFKKVIPLHGQQFIPHVKSAVCSWVTLYFEIKFYNFISITGLSCCFAKYRMLS